MPAKKSSKKTKKKPTRRKTTKKKVSKKKPEVIVDQPTPVRKKSKRTMLVVLLVVLAIILSGVAWAFFRPQDTAVVVTELVRRGTLIQTVEVTGELEAVSEVDLSFETSGTVRSIYFNVGDSVVAGDVIAELSMEELDADVERARQALEIAQAKLNLEEAGASDEVINSVLAEVNAAEAALQAARTALDRVERTSAEDVEGALVALNSAKSDLDNTIAENDQNIFEAKEDLIASMKSSVIEIRSALSDADEVLGVDNSLANDDFEDLIGHESPTTVTQAESAYELATADRDAAEAVVFSLQAIDTVSTLDAAADLVEEAFNSTHDTLLKTSQALDATSLTTIDFSSTDLSGLKASIDAARTSIQIDEEAFGVDRNGLVSALLDAAQAEDMATNAVSQAEQSYTSALVSRSTSVAAAEADVLVQESNVQRANASLAEVEADPRFVDLAAFIADVNRAQADVSAAIARRSRAEIRAPISGQITSVEVEVGEQVTPSTPVVTIQTLQEQFQIVADIPEADIPKIAVNDSVEVTFDAFGDDAVFDGSIVEIDPAEKEIEGVTFYESRIELVMDVAGLKPGMSADLTVLTEEIPDVIIIPQRAVLEMDGQKFVRIPLGNGDYSERIVQTGIRGDDGLIQITSGLQEGEEIIVTIRE